jgi:hypothetical protein
MKRLLAIVPVLFLLSFFGCVQSLQPYYKDNQLFYDPNLVGKWTDADQQNTVVITGDADKKVYTVVLTDEKGKTGSFIMHLAKVQDHMIADIFPDDLKEGDLKVNDEYALHLLPVHSFMMVEYSPPDLRVRQMDFDWFKRYVDAHPDEVAYQKLQGDHYILTGTTDQVQAFVLKHASEKGAFGEAQDVIRIPSTQP